MVKVELALINRTTKEFETYKEAIEFAIENVPKDTKQIWFDIRPDVEEEFIEYLAYENKDETKEFKVWIDDGYYDNMPETNDDEDLIP